MIARGRVLWYLLPSAILAAGVVLWWPGVRRVETTAHSSGAAGAPIAPGVPLRRVPFHDHRYAVAEVDLRSHELVVTTSPEGRQTYPEVLAQLRAAGMQPVLITNGGIYGTQDQPLGLLISRGHRQHDVATGPGDGNFYRDSAVFQIDDDGVASIAPVRGWHEPRHIVAATQSGPQLAEAGKVNPGLRPSTASGFLRTAIGVDAADRHRVRLVVSREPVTLFELASFMVDELHCSEALHLDGDLSALFVPSERDRFVFADPGSRIVTAISVVARAAPGP
jgi:uncharacterized protein YigE (DUF2233 family)